MAAIFQLPEAPIRVNAHGQWLHADEPIHQKVATLFSQHVQPTDDGHYRIEWNNQRHAIEVEDTPFFVRSISCEKKGKKGIAQVRLHTSDGHEEVLDPTTLMQSNDNVLYCRVRRKDFMVPCRFGQGAYHSLALYIEPHQGGYALPLGEDRFVVGAYDARPQRVN